MVVLLITAPRRDHGWPVLAQQLVSAQSFGIRGGRKNGAEVADCFLLLCAAASRSLLLHAAQQRTEVDRMSTERGAWRLYAACLLC